MEYVHRLAEWVRHVFLGIDFPEFSFRRQPFDILPKKKRDTSGGETLSELLDHMEATFAFMKMPTEKGSWLHRDSIKGLKNLGVHVPNPWLLPWDEDPDEVFVRTDKKFPAIMSVSVCDNEALENAINRKDEDNVRSNVAFAIKHKRLPWYVSPSEGVPYEFGYSYYIDGKIFWMSAFLAVDKKTGKIKVCDELKNNSHVIKHRRGGESVYYSRKWSPATLVTMNGQKDGSARKLGAVNVFRAMFNWWLDRELRWSVAVKKGKERVTFGVEDKNTKTYFMDRDKTIKASDGRAKRIIHYVRGHERVTGDKVSVVREHIRGIREFDWKGYHCLITAPTFHQTRLSSEFDLSGEDEEEIKGKTMSLASVGRKLAELEETDRRK